MNRVVESRILGILVMLLLLLARPSLAQDAIPDPISTDDVEIYAQRLDLSGEQRRALEGVHERYRAEWAVLRDGPIAAFLDADHGLGDVSSQLDASVDETARAVRETRAVQARVRSLDGIFFDALALVLTETQQGELPAVRMARQRDRLLSSMTLHLDLGAQVDLVALVTDIDPSSLDEVGRATLQEYERKVTAATRRLHEVALGSVHDVNTAARAEGDGAEPSFQAWGMAWRETLTKLDVLKAAVSDVNRAYARRLGTLLDAEDAATVRRDYVLAAYGPRVWGEGSVDAAFVKALDYEALPDELRESVLAERTVFRSARDRVVEKLMDVEDERRRSNASHQLQMNWGDDFYDDPEVFVRRTAELTERREDLERRSLIALQNLLAAELPGVIGLDVPKRRRSGSTRGLRHSVTVSGDGQAVHSIEGISVDRLIAQFGISDAEHGYLPPPITERDLERWCQRLGASDDERIIARVAHDDYLDGWDVLGHGGAGGQVRTLASSLFTDDAEGRAELPDERTMMRLFDLRRAALEAMRGLDEAFIEELAVVLGEGREVGAFDRIRLDRARSLYLQTDPGGGEFLFFFGDRARSFGDGNETPRLDIARLVDDLDLDAGARAELDPILHRYEAAAADLFRTALDERIEMQRQQAVYMARYLEWNDKSELVASDMTADEAMASLDDRMHRSKDAIRALNRSTRDEVAALLPPQRSADLVRAYKRAGWPQVYRDTGAAHGVLAAARSLDDLSEEQREVIAEIGSEFGSAYEAMSDQMIDTTSDWQDRRRYEQERAELSDAARARLRAVLNDEQARRVGLVD